MKKIRYRPLQRPLTSLSLLAHLASLGFAPEAHEIGHRNRRPVDGHDGGDVQVQASYVLPESPIAGVGGGRRRLCATWWRVEVRFHHDLLLGEIRHQHAGAVIETLDMVNL